MTQHQSFINGAARQMNKRHRIHKGLRGTVLIGMIALVLSFAQVAQAGEHYPGCGSAHYLQVAVDNSNNNGEDDYIGLEYEGCIYDLTKTLVIKADGQVTIEGNGAIISGVKKRRVFYVEPGATLILNNITIRDGEAPYENGNWYGGGIFNDGGTVVINSSTLSGHSAAPLAPTQSWGGAIFNKGGSVTVNNSTFYNNTSGTGGAIRNSDGTVLVNTSVFQGNTATQSGGALAGNGVLTLSNTSVALNSANGNGGGIINTGDLTITGGSLSGNTANANGGGIFNNNGNITLTGTTISDNNATGEGSGIRNKSGTINVNNTTLYNNKVVGSGGGVHNSGTINFAGSALVNNVAQGGNGGGIFNTGTATFTNSTLSGNGADYAAAIFNGGTESVLTLQNTTVSGNGAATGAGGLLNEGTANLGNSILANNFREDCFSNGTVVVTGVNLVEDGGCALAGALSGDPLLGALTAGSPSYFPLLAGSKAIDAGTNINCATSDQRGAARPMDGNGDGTAVCDLGAYEADSVAVVTATPTTSNPNTATPTPTTGNPSTSTPTTMPTTPTATPPDSTAEVTPTATPDDTSMVKNSSFEMRDGNGKPMLEGWTVKNATSDKLKCNKPDKQIANSGECAFQFKGGAGENASLVQNIDLNTVTLDAGAILDFSLFINANSPAVSGKVKLSVGYQDVTLAQDKVTINLRQTNGYEAFSGQLTLKDSPVTKVKLLVSHRSPSGKMYVDTINLSQLEVESLLPLP
jgi:predicted outer membrane repeat protein